MKRQPTYGEVIFGNRISDKRLLFQNVERIPKAQQ